MWEVLQPYLMEVLVAILTAIATFIGAKLKKLYEEKVNTETKEKIVVNCVKAIEQLYKDLSGEEKLEKTLENASEWLNEKGIGFTELELRLLIESAVNGLKHSLKEKGE